MKIKGNFGKYAYVDLNKQEIKEYPIPNEWYQKFIGGRGIAARILLEELDPNVDPLSPENILIFASGPFQGLGIAGAARFLVMAKSPKTKSISDSFCGGSFGHVLGKSGFDGLIIKGKASSPVYISIIDRVVKILPAHNLWGLDPKELEEAIVKDYQHVSIACIGKAGENQVIHSCIMVDKTRAAGRPGYGAIMGSKNLKAVIVQGNQQKVVADKAKLIQLRKEFSQKVAKSRLSQALRAYGTAVGVESFSANGILPTKNFINGQYHKATQISGQALVDSPYWVKRETCPGCPVACKRVVQGTVFEEDFGPEWGGPEYETIASFGSLLLIDDLGVISLCNKKCNQYGLDTISVGVQIAYLMEATERGLLNKEDQIQWGDGKAVSALIDKIAHREGIGEYMARGVEEITKKVGDGSFLVHTKGQEVPMHDPRGKYSMAVYYATTPRGGNHMEGVHDPTPPHKELNLPENPSQDWNERARIASEYLKLRSFANSLILCAFTANLNDGEDYLFPLIRDMLQVVTGQVIDAQEMLAIGERNYDLLRIFAQKAGYNRSSDFLPKRLCDIQPSTGFSIDQMKLKEVLDEYYRINGYEVYGPGKQRAKKLGIAELID